MLWLPSLKGASRVYKKDVLICQFHTRQPTGNPSFPSTQLHTNSLKFESEISPKNGVQNGVRFEKMPLRYSERHFQWRWADSNRRPNTVPGGFLHVYPAFGFRLGNAGRRADPGLSFGAWRSLKESLRASGLNDTPCSGHNRPKACGILVSAAALAA